MNFNHRYYSFYITGLVLMLVGLGIAAETHTPQTITIDQLADICEAMESAICLLYTSPSPRDLSTSRMPSSA